MVTGAALKDQLQERIRAIEQLTSGITDEEASKPPADGEWCIKEVLSHLAGPESGSLYDGIKTFLDEDTPTYDLSPGQSFFESRRADASITELRTTVIDQYSRISDLLGGLSEEQLARTAHMPNFKDTPFGEYPALGALVAGFVNYHMPDHIAQLQSLRG